MPAHRTMGIFVLFIALLGAGAILGVRLTQGQEPDAAEQSDVALGSGFTYQGELSSDGEPVTDTCVLIFALHDAADGGAQLGSTEVENDVAVGDGRFTVVLNDEGQFGPNAFNGEARWLETSVRCSEDSGFSDLGRQPLTAAPYATYALNAGSVSWDDVSGVPDSVTEGVPYSNVIIVAKRGGDFNHVQAALDSIDDASDANRYLVWVAPGVYEEQVTMKEYVDIQGADQELTVIRRSGSDEDPNDYELLATVLGAGNSKLSRLTVENTSDGKAINTVGIHALNTDDTFRISNVTVDASGATHWNKGIVLEDASPQIDHVTVAADGGWFTHGIFTDGNASPTVTDADISAGGGSNQNVGYASHFGHSQIYSSRIQGDDLSVQERSTNDGLVHIAHSQLDGEIVALNFICVHSFDELFDELDDLCSPTLP